MSEGTPRTGEPLPEQPTDASTPRALPAVYADLDAAVRAIAAFRYSRDAIPTTSSVPGGRLVHRMVERATSRQIDGVLRQAQTHADDVSRTLALLTEVVVQQLDDLQDGLAELRRAVNDLQHAREEP